MLIRSESKGDWSGTCGTRRLGTDDPVTIDDHFRVGSNTKTMTGTVVLQLVEEGDIGLDDAVSKYRPEVPNGDNITLAMLLEMRSGLYNYSADEGFNARLDNEPGHAWHRRSCWRSPSPTSRPSIPAPTSSTRTPTRSSSGSSSSSGRSCP